MSTEKKGPLQEKPNGKIPDAEQDVLSSLLRNGGQTARQLRESLADVRPMTHSAVSTLLTRLQEKGLVTRTKGTVGKAFIFQAAKQPQRMYQHILQPLLKRVFGGDMLVLVSSLCEAAPPTADQLDQMQSLIDEYRGKFPSRRPQSKRKAKKS